MINLKENIRILALSPLVFLKPNRRYYGGQMMRLIYIFPICTTHYLLIWSLFNRRSIIKLLFAYRPYAKYYTLHKLLIEDPNTLAVPFLNEDYDKIDTNLIYSKNVAYKIIKQTCFDEFKQMFLSFTNEIVTYKKLNKTLQETLIPNFNLIFQDYVPSEGSISIRIIRELENLLDIPNGDTTYDESNTYKKRN